MFSLKTDSCKVKYCQDGIQVYYKSETMEYTYARIYGHYKIDSDVNGRQYFNNEVEDYGIWWSNGYWLIGPNDLKGMTAGKAYYATKIFCPNALIMKPRSWWMLHSQGWSKANKNIHLKCKYS